MEQLFFELIRVAIGSQDELSREPSAKEWQGLYEMAKKQSLIGICFAGVQRLNASPFTRSYGNLSREKTYNLPETLFLKWMGIAAKIQQKNERVNQQCIELQARLSTDGFKSYILKGQGVAQFYDEPLRILRQSGDIDVWIMDDLTLCERSQKVIAYGRKFSPEAKAFYHHIDAHFFDDTEVELHYTPSWMHSPKRNFCLQKWFEDEYKRMQKSVCARKGICMPDEVFNVVYLLLHIYRHLFKEGIGLRQLLDYYMVLIAYNNYRKVVQKDILTVLDRLGMKNFTSGIMWVLYEVFGMENSIEICVPNEKHGKFILNEIMLAGNFGKYDERYQKNYSANLLSIGYDSMRRMMRFLAYYPSEVLWAPYWKIYHYFVIKRNNKK